MSPTTPPPQTGETATAEPAGATKKTPPAALKYVMLGMFPFLMVVLMVGIMLSGMHKPLPRDMPVAVVGATAPQAKQATAGLAKGLGDSFDLRALTSEAEARALVHDREIAGAYVLPHAGSRQPVLYTAGGAGMSQQQTVQRTFDQIAAQQGATLVNKDLAPLPASDAMGTVTLYLCIGFTMGGFIVVTIMSQAAPELMRLKRMLPVLAAWAVFIAGCVSLLTGPIIGAHHGHFWAVLGLGSAMAFTVSLVTAVFARFLGGLAVIPAVTLMMFLGVPSSNGGVALHMVPGLFQALHGVLPLPALVESIRAVLYFDGDGVAGHLGTLGIWAGAALLVNVVWELRKRRRTTRTPGASGAPAGAQPRVQEAEAV